ncbi:hypothetical protein [Xanthomonas phage NED111]|uniref:Uncharacterized protein n=1 Tax=Xanthomonas phage NED111 TaxID=2982921 RepID=A0AAX3EZ68_9CAUD|nr:hypothetical protein [Xanthomonas phage NED111]
MSKPIVRYRRAIIPPVVGFRATLGDVLAHPNLGDCDIVHTSTVLYVTDGGRKFETRNTRYHQLDSKYEPEGEPDES